MIRITYRSASQPEKEFIIIRKFSLFKGLLKLRFRFIFNCIVSYQRIAPQARNVFARKVPVENEFIEIR